MRAVNPQFGNRHVRARRKLDEHVASGSGLLTLLPDMTQRLRSAA
jgi:hypothetical protein